MDVSCKNTLSTRSGQPHNFVDFERVVDYACEVSKAMLPRCTSEDFRVPPFALVRLARGGKTATASAVFGNSGFKRLDKSDRKVILRSIAAQLMGCAPADVVVPTTEELDAALGDKPVLLIIDEINKLNGGKLNEDSRALLRELFLDKPGRYLLFTSHIWMNLDASQFNGKSPRGSIRGVATTDMSLAHSLDELRNMAPEFTSLTADRAGWYGYIPSLVLTAGRDAGRLAITTPVMRYGHEVSSIEINPNNALKVLHCFVHELLTGKREAAVAKYFQGFQIFLETDTLARVAYPLCYVMCVLDTLNLTPGTVSLLKTLRKLESQLDSTSDGMMWESVVHMAIVLRCMHAQSFGTMGPFDMADLNARPELRCLSLPDSYRTLAAAKILIDKEVEKIRQSTFLHVTAIYSKFEIVDGIVVYCNGKAGAGRLIRTQGYLCKDDKTLHVTELKPVSAKLISDGVKLINRQGIENPSAELPEGWQYVTQGEIGGLLGVSLQLALPRKIR